MKSKLKILLSCLFVLLMFAFIGCSGTLSPTTGDDDQGTQTNQGNQGNQGSQGNTGNQGNTGSSTSVNFTLLKECYDYASFSWKESSNAEISYYVIEIKDFDTKEVVTKTNKIPKNGGPYKVQVRGLEIDGWYEAYLYGYSENDTKLFSEDEDDLIWVRNVYLKEYKVALNTSNQVEHTFEVYDAYGTFKNIKFYSAEKEEGPYTLVCEKECSLKKASYIMETIEFDKTYWFKAEGYDEDGFLIQASEPKSFILEKTKPPKVTSLKSNTDNYDVAELTWDKSAYDDSYILNVYSDSSLSTLILSEELTENSYSLPLDVSVSKSVYVVVIAKNDKGEGPASASKSVYSDLYLAKVNASVTDITANTAKVTLKLQNSSNKDLTAKNATVQYALVKNDTNETVYKDYQDSNVFDLTGLELGSTTSLKGKIKVSYEYDGEAKVYEKTGAKFDVKTTSFPVPTNGNWSVVATGRSFITVKFPTLTTEELCGVSADDVVYTVTAYKDGSSYSATSKTSAAGEYSVKVTGLVAGTAYNFTVKAKKNTSDAVAGEESEKSSSYTTTTSLSKPTITTITETSPESPYTHITVTFSPISEDTNEVIKYGLVWDVMNKTNVSTFSGKINPEDALPDVTTITQKVNCGNKYKVSLYAYEESEGTDSIVYSDVVPIQLNAVNYNSSIPGGLYYTSDPTLQTDSQLCDIVKSQTWDNGITPRSTNDTYSWGFVNVGTNASNNAVDTVYAFKFSLTEDMREKSYVKFYLLKKQYSWKTEKVGTTPVAYGASLIFIRPDGEVIKDFTFSDSYIPDYDSTGSLSYPTLEKPSSMGVIISNNIDCIFDNCIYLRVVIPGSNNAPGNSVGLSYYY